MVIAHADSYKEPSIEEKHYVTAYDNGVDIIYPSLHHTLGAHRHLLKTLISPTQVGITQRIK